MNIKAFIGLIFFFVSDIQGQHTFFDIYGKQNNYKTLLNLTNQVNDSLDGFLDLRDLTEVYGYLPKFKYVKKENPFQQKYSWIHTLEQPICLNKDSSFLDIELYLQNVEIYNIHVFVDDDSLWYTKTFTTKCEYYQEPIVDFYKKWLNNIGEELFINKNKLSISRIAISIPRKESKSNFVILTFLFKEIVGEQYVKIEHPLFGGTDSQSILKDNSQYYFKNPQYTLSDFPCYNENFFSGRFYVNPFSENDTNQIELIHNLLLNILNCYPYYKEKKLSKEHSISTLNKFKNFNYSDYLDSTINFVSSFNDAHFKIIDYSKNRYRRIRYPLRLYNINESNYICAVFDTSSSIQKILGNKLLAVDSIINPSITDFYSVFNKKFEDTISIVSVNKIQDTITSNLCFNSQKYTIPSNFKPIHCEFYEQNGISYFRLNKFDYKAWFKYINYFERIKNSKGIIFDLRGNGGGDFDICLKIFSTFIYNPKVIRRSRMPNSAQEQSLVLNPNVFFRLNKPVVILVDENTACASEAFTYLMKYYNNATIIGNSRTMGAYGAKLRLILPNNIEIITNSYVKETFYPNKIIENEGITPDIHVLYTNVFDLYPYNDLIKNTAFRYLSNF